MYMGRSLLIFSDIIFKMDAWWPYWFYFSVSGLCRRHGFWSLSQFCFGVSISNLICILMVVIGRSLLLLSDIISKWRPGGHFGIFGFQTLTSFGCEHQLQTSVAQYLCIWVGAFWFSATLISKWPPGRHIGFFGFRTLTLVWLYISTPNFSGAVLMYMGRSLLIYSDVNFKMAAWQPYWIFWFPDSNISLALNMNLKLQWPNTCVYE